MPVSVRAINDYIEFHDILCGFRGLWFLAQDIAIIILASQLYYLYVRSRSTTILIGRPFFF